MKTRILGVVCLLAFLSPAAVAQFGGGIVFDPTQSGHAIAQIQQAQQLYTTALQARNEIISTYNLARQMAGSRRAARSVTRPMAERRSAA